MENAPGILQPEYFFDSKVSRLGTVPTLGSGEAAAFRAEKEAKSKNLVLRKEIASKLTYVSIAEPEPFPRRCVSSCIPIGSETSCRVIPKRG
jgi:hypothetical protein